MSEAIQEIIAVRYGTVELTEATAYHRHSEYAEPDGPVAMDYYFWILRRGTEAILFDTGFAADDGRARGRTVLVTIAEILERLGISTRQVTCVVVSHAHYDHIGNLGCFPEAMIVVQQQEMACWESDLVDRRLMSSVTSAEGLDQLRRARDEGRLLTVDGDHSILSGLSTVALPGHTPGSQGLLVAHATGDVLLAADAAHFYRELHEDRPFAIFTDLPDMYRSLERLRAYEREGVRVVAGHDPDDMRAFPPVPGLEGIAVRVEGNTDAAR